MASGIEVKLSVTGAAQANAALASVQQNVAKTGTAAKIALQGQQSTLKASGQIFNQLGNIIGTFGNSQLAGLISQLQASVGSIAGMNAQLGKSKLAIVALGSAVAVGGFQLGDYLRQFIPGLNADLKLTEATQAQEKMLDIQKKMAALRDPEKFRSDPALEAVDKQIDELESQYKTILGIQTGFRRDLTEDQQLLLDALRQLRDETSKLKAETLESENAKLLRTFIEKRARFHIESGRVGVIDESSGEATGGELGGRITLENLRHLGALEQIQGATGRLTPGELDQVTEDETKEHTRRLEDIWAAHHERLLKREAAAQKQKLQIQQDYLQASASILGSFAELARLFGRKGFIAWKALAIAQAVINGANAVLTQLGGGDPYSAPFRAIAAGVAAGVQIAVIAATQPEGYRHGGYTGDGSENTVAGTVHGQEFVINAPDTRRLGVQNIGQFIETGVPSGPSEVNVGSPTVNNVVIFDESALRNITRSRAFADGVLNIVRVNKVSLGIA